MRPTTTGWLILLNLVCCTLNVHLGNYAAATLSGGAFFYLLAQQMRES